MNFIEKIKEFADHQEPLKVGRDVNELRTKFEDYLLEEERKAQVAVLEAQERKDSELINKVAEMTKNTLTELALLKDSFYESYAVFKEKRKAVSEEKSANEEKNLLDKMDLINRLRKTVTSEENISSAFASLKEIQEKWKTIGDIPREKRNEIQVEYSHLLDDFFYNIKIYRDLKDHDFHRNAQLKHELIDKLKELGKQDKIKEIEAQLKVLQNDWNDVGPVPNEEWESIKELYWTEVRSIYNKINRFYDDRREKMIANLEQKKVLLEKTKSLVESRVDIESSKGWEKITKEILEIQKTWKAIGFGPKKENDAIWKEFRAECDLFFDAKKEFFSKIQGEYDKIADKKRAIIEKAKSLKDSKEWKDAANKLKQLQAQWKQLGHSGVKHEQKLWKEFRSHCDAFFNARQATFDEKDKQNEANLALKQAVIDKIKAYKVNEDDKQGVLADLKAFSAEFSAIGHVPIKLKDEVFNTFKNTMDAHYKSIKMSAEEQERILFEAKVDVLKSSGNASRQFAQMKMDLRKQIDLFQKDINQLENNLGFFANSKGADSLRKEVEKKVDVLKDKIMNVRKQIKIIPNE